MLLKLKKRKMLWYLPQVIVRSVSPRLYPSTLIVFSPVLRQIFLALSMFFNFSSFPSSDRVVLCAMRVNFGRFVCFLCINHQRCYKQYDLIYLNHQYSYSSYPYRIFLSSKDINKNQNPTLPILNQLLSVLPLRFFSSYDVPSPVRVSFC